MALFENFPYTNLHELNLDWLIEEMKKMQEQTVLSVNGMTGEVVLYRQATVQFPEVADDHWSIVRLSDGTTRGIVFGNDDKAYIIHGGLMSQLYGQNNQPPYPVTSVNGQTGAVTIFADQYVQLAPLTDASMHSWSLFRKLSGKDVGIDFDDTGNTYIIDGVNRYQVLTTADIPTGSGVFSVNGLEGVVILTADDIDMDTDDTRTIKQAIDSIIDDEYDMDNSITYTERGNTATQNIPLGKYVIWKNKPYVSIASIAMGDILSTSNLSLLNHGIVDNLLQTVNSNSIQISTLNNTVTNYISRIDGSTAKGVNDTQQIPSAMMSKHILLITCRRYGFGSTVVVPVMQITQQRCVNGIALNGVADATDTAVIKIDGTGLITVVSHSNSTPFFIDIEAIG